MFQRHLHVQATSHVRRTWNTREGAHTSFSADELARTGEVVKGDGAAVQRPTAQDVLVDMEIVGISIFAHRLIDTVLSRYPMAI